MKLKIITTVTDYDYQQFSRTLTISLIVKMFIEAIILRLYYYLHAKFLKKIMQSFESRNYEHWILKLLLVSAFIFIFLILNN